LESVSHFALCIGLTLITTITYSLEVTSQKVLKKLAYDTLLGGHAKKVVSISKFCADSESTNSRILSLPKLKLLQKTKRHLGWVRKKEMWIVQNSIQFYQAILKKKYLLKCQK